MKKFVFVLLVVVVSSSSTKKSDEHPEFSKIVPDVVSVAPKNLLKVEYPKSHKEAKLGNELAPKDVHDPPTVTYEGEPHAFYTLVMTDPDAPSRKNPKSKEWHHWLVVNIPGSDVAKGQVLTEYVGSAPPKDSGLHRYVFLLYKQPQQIQFEEEHKSKTNGNRAKFSTENFAKKYKLGDPLAGNFFEAQYDDSVPAVHRQLQG